MKELLIIGARGYGREIYNLAISCKEYNKDFIIKGFLDDKSDALDNFSDYPPIIDSVENYIPQPDDVFICALGDVNYKKKYIDIIQEKNVEFYTLIHPTVIVSSNARIGKGVVISQFSTISCDVEIRDFVTIQPYCTLGHDVKVASYCHLNTYSFMGGSAVLEEEVTLHTGSIILPHKTVKRKSIVGAGSVVIRTVPEKCTVHGNPAKKLL